MLRIRSRLVGFLSHLLCPEEIPQKHQYGIHPVLVHVGHFNHLLLWIPILTSGLRHIFSSLDDISQTYMFSTCSLTCMTH